jgi:hypothetical protein
MRFALRRGATVHVVRPDMNVLLEIRGRESNNLFGFAGEPIDVLEDTGKRGRRRTIRLPRGCPCELIRLRDRTFVKDASMQNICSPYVIVPRQPNTGEESAIVSKQFSAVTTVNRMQSFVKDCLAVNDEAGEHLLYMLATFQAAENLFLLMIERERIPFEQAERDYNRYAKLKARIFGANPTPDGMRQHLQATSKFERRVAYDKAFSILRRAVGLPPNGCGPSSS